VEKEEPVARISWPKDPKGGTIKLTGDLGSVALGKRIHVELEGPVRGFAMQEYGCSIELKVKSVHVELLGDRADESEDYGEPMTDTVAKLHKRQGKDKE